MENNIGIVGTGEIAKAMVEGLCQEHDSTQIWLSPRNSRIARELSNTYENVSVALSNQDVIDRAKVIMVAVRYQSQDEALSQLHIAAEKVLINVMAGVSNQSLRARLRTDASIIRAIPLPAVRVRSGITVTFPKHPDVDSLFEKLGGVISVESEEEFNVFSSLTATLTTHYSYLVALTSWAAEKGVSEQQADRYVRFLFQSTSRALGLGNRSLSNIASDYETAGGINEYVRVNWFNSLNKSDLRKTLDALYCEIN